ncbi:MAG: hypothetical protein IKW45_05425 [Clostridia bacterium]|nr:hypothetical protein [Clostridia bacterium]
MAEKRKLTLKDHIQAWAGGIGSMVGLFIFCVILGMIFMDYNPMDMLNGIKSDLLEIFEKISNLWRCAKWMN